MERRTLPRRLSWLAGTVIATRRETARARSITFAVPDWMPHRPGQHVDVRLTAEDGYQAERSYSIASAPQEDRHITLTVELIENGEVSPYLVEELQVGDQLELRGPLGGYFVWEPKMGGPLLLLAGGSGVVPLMAMIRARAVLGSHIPTRLLYSARSYDDVIYREELERMQESAPGLEVIYTLTRTQPAGWTGYQRRVDGQMLREVGWSREFRPLTYICGPTSFVEAAAQGLVDLAYEPALIKTERFGATGDA